MTVNRALLHSWRGKNVRHYCFEYLRGPVREQAVRQAREYAGLATLPPSIPGDTDPFLRNDDEYQCAHFVAHVLGIVSSSIGAGTTYRHMRVHEIARVCRNFERIDDLDLFHRGGAPDRVGLFFVAASGSVGYQERQRRCTHISGTDRHVGIYINGDVWHYENDHRFESVIEHPIHQTMYFAEGGGRISILQRYSTSSQGTELYLADFPSLPLFPRSYSEHLRRVASDLRSRNSGNRRGRNSGRNIGRRP